MRLASGRNGTGIARRLPSGSPGLRGCAARCSSRRASTACRASGSSGTGYVSHSTLFEGPVTGSLDADVIRFSFAGRYGASNLSYCFEGRVEDGAMAGTVELGAASDQNGGVVNRSQFGTGEWQARRVA